MSISHIFRGTVAIVSAVFFPMLAMAEEAKSPGIITSISRSATISTGGMPPGSEMWAMWISLPAGKKVELKEPKVPSTWMGLDVGLTGSTVSATLSGKAPEEGCVLFGADGQKNITGQETTTRPGDAFACNFTTGVPYWEENRGSELYSRAQLNIGGPVAPGQWDTPEDYRRAGGWLPSPGGQQDFIPRGGEGIAGYGDDDCDYAHCYHAAGKQERGNGSLSDPADGHQW